MKRLVIFLLCQLLIFISPVSQLLAAEPPAAVSDSTHVTLEQGIADGSAAASDHYGSGKWLAYGAGSGFLLGLIGTGIAVAISQTGQPQPPVKDVSHISNGTDAYKLAFADSYAKRSKKKALGMTLIGGAVGTAVVVGLIASAQK